MGRHRRGELIRNGSIDRILRVLTVRSALLKSLCIHPASDSHAIEAFKRDRTRPATECLTPTCQYLTVGNTLLSLAGP
jgi:hypothetical protein